jgi:hypothetical protein
MKSLTRAVFAVTILASAAAQPNSNPFLGRWDVTVATERGTYPGWIQVQQTDCCLIAVIQPRSGGTFSAAGLERNGSRLTVTHRQAAPDRPLTVWELAANGDRLTGTVMLGGKVTGQLTAVRAPALQRPRPRAWSDAEPLFNGRDLTGWEPINPKNSHWIARNGELVNERGGSNLKSTRTFDDFKLHIEYNCPEPGNSGIYLRGRYEIQIWYDAKGTNDRFHDIGSIYSFLAPAVDLPKTPGQWESLDVTLVGRFVTIVRNGVKIIDNKEIPGITGGALDSREGEPGPFYFQGDHSGGVRFRNIRVSVPKV